MFKNISFIFYCCSEFFKNFIESAVKSGAAGYFTSDKTKIFENAQVVFFVPDTKEAYLRLANFHKNKINPFTIMITGSSGKTTVKEMMYCVFSLAGKTVKSVLNHNNETGLCQTLSAVENDTEYLIVEAGMRGFGEIELISEYAEPDIGVIVNSGTAHIGRLGSELNIAKAKFEITTHLKPDGILISHDNKLIKQINDNKHKTIYFSLDDKNLKIKEMTSESSLFEYKGIDYKLSVPGLHNVQNALSVIEAALWSNISVELIKKGLENFVPIEKRWNIVQIGGYNIINDSYNSNPESVKAAIQTFLEYTKGVKVLVLGDMGELGKNEVLYHKFGALEVAKGGRAFENADRKEQHQKPVANGLHSAVDGRDGAPDRAALERLRRFRQQRPHFRQLVVPRCQRVLQVIDDPVVIQKVHLQNGMAPHPCG